MICGIEGILRACGDDWVVIAVGGVSFHIKAPTSTLGILGDLGDRVELHTYLQVKEDDLSLYGFASVEEMDLFELLLGVSGIGPRAALALLSALGTERLRQAIASGNVDLLSSVTGVGKKSAARIILELKSKMEWLGVVATPLHEDVIVALTGLGYSVAEATRAVAAIPNSSDLTLEDKIRLALQYLGTC
ncbi:Holliday junction branch migration protein RuvA [Chloroflexota bacterium]